MAEPIVVHDPDAFLDLLRSKKFDDLTPDMVQFGDGFNIKIILKGEQWTGGEVDYRVGQFITRLQKDILAVYSQVTGEKVDFRSPFYKIEPFRVTVTTQDGSLEMLLKLTKAVKSLWRELTMGMTGAQKVVTAGIVAAAAAGAFVAYVYLCNEHERKTWEIKSNEALKVQEIQSEERLETIRLIQGGGNAARAHQSGMHYLVSAMDNADEIEIPGRGESFTKVQAKQLLPKPPQDAPDEPITAWVDDSFSVHVQNFDTSEITLRCAGQKIVASTNQMPLSERKKFQELVGEAIAKKEPPTLSLRVILQIDAEKKEILSGSVLMLNPDDGRGQPFRHLLKNELASSRIVKK